MTCVIESFLTPVLTPASVEPWAKNCPGDALTSQGPSKCFREAPAMSKSTGTSRKINEPKPPKPYADFPLFPHATKRWAKKIRGRMIYFGPWADPDGALAKYLEQKDVLHRGLAPSDTDEGLTVLTLCAKFLTTKKRLLQADELSPRSFEDYTSVCKRIIKAFGKTRIVADLRPDDFEKLRTKMAKAWGPVRVGNEINRVRIVFNYAFKSGLIDRPMVYGEGFKRPSKKVLRKHRLERGAKMFQAEEIRRMLARAKQPLKSMILLGINCGYGNTDVGTLPLSAIDLTGGWVNYGRPKTGIARRCWLWPETVGSIKEWLAKRRDVEGETGGAVLFHTRQGGSWAKEVADSPVTKETRKLLDTLGIKGRRNFYAIRHTFQTIGDDSKDFITVRAIMGHADADIAATYRERITDDRLRAVAEHVRVWLFG